MSERCGAFLGSRIRNNPGLGRVFPEVLRLWLRAASADNFSARHLFADSVTYCQPSIECSTILPDTTSES